MEQKHYVMLVVALVGTAAVGVGSATALGVGLFTLLTSVLATLTTLNALLALALV